MNGFRKPHGGGGQSRGGFNDRRGGGGGFNRGAPSGGNRDFDRPLFKATCAECGNTCEVPFRPTGEKPVYCNNCFSEKRGMEGPRDNFRPREDRPQRSFAQTPPPVQDRRLDDIKRQLDIMQKTIDTLIQNMSVPKTVAAAGKIIEKAEAETASKKKTVLTKKASLKKK